MRLLADENFPGDAVAALQASGHDVEWVRTLAPGISDREVLPMPKRTNAYSLHSTRILGN